MAHKRVLIAAAISLLIAACGGDAPEGFGAFGPGNSDESITTTGLSDIDVCGLLSPAELTAVLGEAPEPKESEPAGPFTGCSWGTGDVLVSVAQTNSLILAPGEDECPSAGISEESYACEGRIKFLVKGTHVSVATIDPFLTAAHLQALAEVVHDKLSP